MMKMISFKFKFVSDTARRLLVYEPQDNLYEDSIVNEFDDELIKNFLFFGKSKPKYLFNW